MVTLTITEARDEAMKIIDDAVTASPTFAGEKIVWSDTADDVPKDASLWMRPTFRHTGAEQVSLSGGLGTARFERRGLLTVEGYLKGGLGQNEADEWLQLMLDSLEGKRSPGGIIFRNVAPREDGQDGVWWRTVVTAEFEYDQIK